MDADFINCQISQYIEAVWDYPLTTTGAMMSPHPDSTLTPATGAESSTTPIGDPRQDSRTPAGGIVRSTRWVRHPLHRGPIASARPPFLTPGLSPAGQGLRCDQDRRRPGLARARSYSPVRTSPRLHLSHLPAPTPHDHRGTKPTATNPSADLPRFKSAQQTTLLIASPLCAGKPVGVGSAERRRPSGSSRTKSASAYPISTNNPLRTSACARLCRRQFFGLGTSSDARTRRSSLMRSRIFTRLAP